MLNVVERRPKEAAFAPWPAGVDPRVVEWFRQDGVIQLYTHQAVAVGHALAGHDVLVTTSTSSGKSLCYNVPVLQACVTEPHARALYLFPTKALAHDQLDKFRALVPDGTIEAAPYDGDTARASRALARRQAHVLLTNPDMLHNGMLPGHEPWAQFLKSLRYIVLDEVHTYRGLFGTQVAGVLRRLLRLAAWHGARPQLVGCSATVADPVDFFGRLTGRRPELVDEDGGPSGRHRLVTVGAPEGDVPARPNLDTAEVLARLTTAGLRTMAFCGSRRGVEEVLRRTRQILGQCDFETDAVDSYRGGYTAAERRSIERALQKGKLRGLVTTNAMEMGIDVGTLDVVLLNGCPGTVSSFWQQSGRAGRSGRDGVTVYLARQDALEQLLAREPGRLDGVEDPCVLGMDNAAVVGGQLRCAAYERALAPAELPGFAPCAQTAVDQMVEVGELTESSGRYYYPAHVSPSRQVNLRGEPGRQVLLLDHGEVIGSMEPWRAQSEAFAGAVYLHRSETYVVDDLDLDRGEATLHREDPGFVTQSYGSTSVDPHTVLRQDGRVSLVGLTVTSSVTGFRRVSPDGATLTDEELHLPAKSLDTVGLRLDLDLLVDGDDPTPLAVVHSLQHILVSAAPLLAGCDRRDLLTSWYGVFPDNFRPAIFIADGVQGGIGFAERLYDRFDQLVDAAQSILRSCDCLEGCPACLLSSWCEAGNSLLDKTATLAFVSRGLGGGPGILGDP